MEAELSLKIGNAHLKVSGTEAVVLNALAHFLGQFSSAAENKQSSYDEVASSGDASDFGTEGMKEDSIKASFSDEGFEPEEDDDEEVEDLRLEAVKRLGKQLGVEISRYRKRRNYFASEDRKVHCVVLTSKRYEREGRQLWYGLSPNNWDFLEESGGQSYLLLVDKQARLALVLDGKKISVLLNGNSLSTTVDENGGVSRFHFHIDVKNGCYELKMKNGRSFIFDWVLGR